MRRRLFAMLLAAPAIMAGPFRRPAAQEGGVTVFAAASLQDALRELARSWQARGRPAPRLSLGSSSALARQIEQGAPADLFLSADEPWMDYVQQRDLIVPDTRSTVLGNTLVLISPADQPGPELTLARGTDLMAPLGAAGRLATGDPAHVPVGRYAEAALRWMGQWDAVAPRLARTENVRAALLLVERGEAPLGIVYLTDAAASRGVRVRGSFPPESHPPIAYPFALTKRGERTEGAREFLAFIAGPEAVPVWQRFGFKVGS
jgi:molybdate transport system substrate-binding protein